MEQRPSAYAAEYGTRPVRFDRYTSLTPYQAWTSVNNAPPHLLLASFTTLDQILMWSMVRLLVRGMTQSLRTMVVDEFPIGREPWGAETAMPLCRLRHGASRGRQGANSEAPTVRRLDQRGDRGLRNRASSGHLPQHQPTARTGDHGPRIG